MGNGLAAAVLDVCVGPAAFLDEGCFRRQSMGRTAVDTEIAYFQTKPWCRRIRRQVQICQDGAEHETVAKDRIEEEGILPHPAETGDFGGVLNRNRAVDPVFCDVCKFRRFIAGDGSCQAAKRSFQTMGDEDSDAVDFILDGFDIAAVEVVVMDRGLQENQQRWQCRRYRHRDSSEYPSQLLYPWHILLSVNVDRPAGPVLS